MSQSYLDKIFSRCKATDSGCLEWNGCFNTDGYPRAGITKTREDGTKYYDSNIKLHRLVYQQTRVAEDIEGRIVRHTCDNPKCLNPVHLDIGTQEDNVQDRVVRERTKGHVGEGERKTVIDLRRKGLTYKEISDKLNIKRKRVEYIITRRGG